MLTVAVRPPEYFPGLPYMALLQAADRFVLGDTFEYSRRSYQNRARLRTPQGAQWITVPVRQGQTHCSLTEVAIDNREHWQSRHWRAMQYDYRSTPYFELFEPQLAPFFERDWHRLGPCACASVELLADLGDLPGSLTRASERDDAPEALSEVLGAYGEDVTLLSLPETASHDAKRLKGTDWDVRVLTFDSPHYRQNFEGFEPNLSFADLLFGYGPEARIMLAKNAHVRPFEAEVDT